MDLNCAYAIDTRKNMTLHLKFVHHSNGEEHQLESSFKSDAAFIEIEKRLETDKEALMKKVNAIFCFELSGGPGNEKGVWYIDAKDEGIIHRGKDSKLKADCTIRMNDVDCLKILTGQLNPQTAFLQGKVKVNGNMGLAMKLQQLQATKLTSKL